MALACSCSPRPAFALRARAGAARRPAPRAAAAAARPRAAVAAAAFKPLDGGTGNAGAFAEVVFNSFSAALGIPALGMVIAPAQAAAVAAGATATVGAVAVAGQIRILAGFYVLAALAAHSVATAAAAGRLGSSTYQRLLVGLAAAGALALYSLQEPGVALAATPLLAGKVVSGALAASSLLMLAFGCGRGLLAAPVALVKGTLTAATSVLKISGPASAAYSLGAVATAAITAILASGAPPRSMVAVPANALGAFLMKHTAAGAALAVAACLVLADGARRERLGASTFRVTNLGLAAALLSIGANVGWWVHTGVVAATPAAAGDVFGLGGLGLFALYQYFTATRA
jgi:hypothetical protein